MSRPAQSGPVIPDEPPRDSLSPLNQARAGDEMISGLEGKSIDCFAEGEVFVLGKTEVDVLRRFRNRTVFTIGTARSVRQSDG